MILPLIKQTRANKKMLIFIKRLMLHIQRF